MIAAERFSARGMGKEIDGVHAVAGRGDSDAAVNLFPLFVEFRSIRHGRGLRVRMHEREARGLIEQLQRALAGEPGTIVLPPI